MKHKYGVHYAAWGNEWDVDIKERICLASQAGFDDLEVTPPSYIAELDLPKMDELKKMRRRPWDRDQLVHRIS